MPTDAPSLCQARFILMLPDSKELGKIRTELSPSLQKNLVTVMNLFQYLWFSINLRMVQSYCVPKTLTLPDEFQPSKPNRQTNRQISGQLFAKRRIDF